MLIIGRLHSLADEYRASLKPRELEEPLDVMVYRPLAFLLVRVLRHAPVTANQVSVASLLAGVTAGMWFWQGTAKGYAIGALSYFLSNVLDCADGQLARLRRTTSVLGYILDGTVDTLSAAAVFVGIAHGRPASFTHKGLWVCMTASAGASMLWSSLLVDRKRQEWMRRAIGRTPDEEGELRAIRERTAQERSGLARAAVKSLLTLLAAYRRLGDWVLPREETGRGCDQRRWAVVQRPLHRAAIMTGPTFHLTALVVAAAVNRIQWYLVGATVVGILSASLLPLAEHVARRHCVGRAPETV